MSERLSHLLLEATGIYSGYGSSMVVQDVNLGVPRGEVVAVLGRNGVGKTTLIHTVMGMVPVRRGSILLEGREIAGEPSHSIARMGVGLVPQGRRIFARLTVEENLLLAGRREGEWTLELVYELLPRLRERKDHRGNQLSGGEQQMLAIGRALLGNPRLLLLDEPSDGLAPMVVDDITAILSELRDEGMSAVLVEQNLAMAVELATVVHIMSKGHIVFRAGVDEFRRDPDVARRLLGVG